MLQHRPEQQSTLHETALPIAQAEQTVAPATLSDEEVEALIAQLRKRIKPGQLKVFLFMLLTVTLPSLFTFSLVFALINLLGTLSLVPILLLFTLYGAPFFVFLFYLHCVVPKRFRNAQRAEDLRKMEASGDPRFIEPLFDIWRHSGNFGASYEIAPVMTKLISQIDATQANQLSAKTRKYLLDALKIAPNILLGRAAVQTYKAYHAPFMTALIRTLTHLEETEAIRYLRPLIKARGRESYMAELRTVAQECLAILERKAQENQQTETLLRPVEGSRLPTNELLRPAEGNVETAPETLLRPTAKKK